MSGDQVQNALKLQRLKLFSRLEQDIFHEHTDRDCCKQPISEGDLMLLDGCFDNTSNISEKEKSSLHPFFRVTYVEKKLKSTND